jgi:hypothetical protein
LRTQPASSTPRSPHATAPTRPAPNLRASADQLFEAGRAETAGARQIAPKARSVFSTTNCAGLHCVPGISLECRATAGRDARRGWAAGRFGTCLPAPRASSSPPSYLGRGWSARLCECWGSLPQVKS